jgi:2-keto-3-deoxy-L-rhamnonate aldolase RhmA
MAERPVYGTFLKLPRAEIVEMLAIAGYDFLICDMEHAQITELEARHVLQAARAAGIAALVRLPDPEQGIVNRLLEAGAAGIQLPRHRSAQDAARLGALLRHPPDGVRSVGNAYALAGYGTVPPSEYLPAANASAILVGQLETRAVEQPIASAIAGLDVAFIGLMDLSVDFGVPGQFGDPRVAEHVQAIERAAAQAGIALGGVAGSPEQAAGLVEAGYRFLALASDTTMFLQSARSLLAGMPR